MFSVANQVLQYNLSNRAVAVLCNHKKTASKNFNEQIGRQDEKIDKKKEAIQEAQDNLDEAKSKAVRYFVFLPHGVSSELFRTEKNFQRN